MREPSLRAGGQHCSGCGSQLCRRGLQQCDSQIAREADHTHTHAWFSAQVGTQNQQPTYNLTLGQPRRTSSNRASGDKPIQGHTSSFRLAVTILSFLNLAAWKDGHPLLHIWPYRWTAVSSGQHRLLTLGTRHAYSFMGMSTIAHRGPHYFRLAVCAPP